MKKPAEEEGVMLAHRPSQTLPDERSETPLAVRSYEEVAAILGCCWQAVWQGEQRAMRKLAADPEAIRLWEEVRG